MRLPLYYYKSGRHWNVATEVEKTIFTKINLVTLSLYTLN